MIDSTWVVAGATVALVLVTVAYTYTTRRAYIEMERTRLEAIRPALQVAPTVLAVNFPLARITNVGRGNALNIVATLRLLEGGTERWRYEWHEALLVPGGSRAFAPQHNPGAKQLEVDDLVRSATTFIFAAKMEDAFGRAYESNGFADWREIKDHLWGANALREDPELPEAVKHLEKIAESLRGLVNPFDGIRVMTYRERQQRDREQMEFLQRRQQTEAETPSESPASDEEH